MKKMMTAAALTGVLGLVAAFAPVPSMPTPTATTDSNVTTIYKTDPHWPVRGMMTANPCAVRTCQSI